MDPAPLAVTDNASADTHELITDGRGTVTGAAGQASGQPAGVQAFTCLSRFDAWGQPSSNINLGAPAGTPTDNQPVTGTCAQGTDTLNPLHWNSGRTDLTTNSYQFGGRTYSPSRSTWSTPDAMRNGSTTGDAGLGADPLTRNSYTYVNGDPINLVDPSGHEQELGDAATGVSCFSQYGGNNICHDANDNTGNAHLASLGCGKDAPFKFDAEYCKFLAGHEDTQLVQQLQTAASNTIADVGQHITDPVGALKGDAEALANTVTSTVGGIVSLGCFNVANIASQTVGQCQKDIGGLTHDVHIDCGGNPSCKVNGVVDQVVLAVAGGEILDVLRGVAEAGKLAELASAASKADDLVSAAADTAGTAGKASAAASDAAGASGEAEAVAGDVAETTAPTITSAAPDGRVYLRQDLNGGPDYVGQAKSGDRYVARQGEHNIDHPNAKFVFTELGRANPGTDLDVLEQFYIDQRGGANNLIRNPNSKLRGTLGNSRNQMSPKRYLLNSNRLPIGLVP